MIYIFKRLFVLVGLLCGTSILLAGCAGSDPFARPGTWHETDAPMHNIAVELVNPRDLHDWNGDQTLSGEIAVSAVQSALSSLGNRPVVSGSSSTAGRSSGSDGTSGFSRGMSPGAPKL